MPTRQLEDWLRLHQLLQSCCLSLHQEVAEGSCCWGYRRMPALVASNAGFLRALAAASSANPGALADGVALLLAAWPVKRAGGGSGVPWRADASVSERARACKQPQAQWCWKAGCTGQFCTKLAVTRETYPCATAALAAGCFPLRGLISAFGCWTALAFGL